jgi:hypothetical protein
VFKPTLTGALKFKEQLLFPLFKKISPPVPTTEEVEKTGLCPVQVRVPPLICTSSVEEGAKITFASN